MANNKNIPQNEQNFNLTRFFLGLFIIILGIMFLAQNAGWITWNFNLDWSIIWPIIIIIIGLSLLSTRSTTSKIFGIIIGVLTILFLILIIFGNINFITSKPIKQNISISKEENIKSAEINIKIGAGKLKIQGETSNLVSGMLNSNIIKLDIDSKVEDNVQKINLEGRGRWRILGKGNNILELELNQDIPIKLNINSGATDLELDLSNIKIEKLTLNIGATSVDLILGDKYDKGKVEIKGGASSLNVKIPKTLATKLHINSGLTSKNLIDFTQIDKENYLSYGYDKTTKKLELDFDLGASSLDVSWR